MNQELDLPINPIGNPGFTPGNDWLRIANNVMLESSNPTDPGSCSEEAEDCGGDPVTPSDRCGPDPPDAEQGGDSYTQSD